jgi:hypothetical protein
MGAPPPPAQTAKPLIAGIMLIVFGLINAVYMAYNIITLETATSQYEGIGGDFLSFMADLFMICFAILMIFSIISVLGGIFAIKREKFSIAIIGAILGLFSLGPYCLSSIVALIALILLFVSKDEFL